MNKVKMMVLAIMIMFIVNVSVFCILVYHMNEIYTNGLHLNGTPEEKGNKSINIDKGEILIINKCEKN